MTDDDFTRAWGEADREDRRGFTLCVIGALLLWAALLAGGAVLWWGLL